MTGARTTRLLLRDLGRLVVPVACPGCGALDEPLCGACGALLRGPVRRCEWSAPRLDRMDGSPPVPVWAIAPYVGPVRAIVVAWKERGRADLTPAVVAAFGAGAAHVARVVRDTGDRSLPLLVVPAPSSAAARRRRGDDLVVRLARAAVAACAEQGVPARVAPVLAQRWGVRDQVGLGARARGRNVGDRVRWRTGATRPGAGQWALLVDDVLTTGATLAACERLVTGSGALVVGAMTLAVTPPPGARRGDRDGPGGAWSARPDWAEGPMEARSERGYGGADESARTP
ncbi:ComF family protein [Cellulomonas fimi]|uniref:ComF family protein n=1 Tax=Cellulomonas fimi TaxID=1708 RepID=UPI001B86E4E4|nr:ComF family protein [Cellulomonas fimi]